MESKTNFTVVGIVVLVLAAALLSTLLWLSVGFDRKQYHTYLVYIDESVHGLSEESPVKFNGVKVGMVSSVELDDHDPQKIKLLLKIDKDILITISTRATLVTQGITGTTFLGLSATTPSVTPLEPVKGEPYPVIPYTVSFFGRMEDNFTELSDSLKRVFDPENARLLKDSLVSLNDILDTVSKNNHNIQQTLQSLPKVMLELKTSVREFGAMTQKISLASTQVSKTMQVGREGINQMTQQMLPTATTLLQRLDIITANLEQVSVLMRQNPAVIVRGTQPEPSGPGE